MSETTDLSGVSLNLVDSVEKAGEFISWLNYRRPMGAVSVDIETGELPGNDKKDALSPWHGQIRLAQVGDGQTGWAIPWDEWSGVFYQGMDKYQGPIVCHNIAFEARWFAVQSKWKLPWHQAHDTMLMSQIVDPQSKAGLKYLASQHIDARAVALQDTMHAEFAKNGWTWGTVPISFEPYWAYGALDTVLTARLFTDHFWPLVQPGAKYSIPYELEMATRRITTAMEINGARVDLEYSQRKYDELQAYTESVKEWGRKEFGGQSISSNVQLVRIFEGLGAEITETTPSGQKSMNKDQLAILAQDSNSAVRQLAQTVLSQRKADKLASSYFLNFMNDAVDGVLHPNINIMAARTGRMSVTNPALQTLPSGENTVRSAFIPKDGHGIVSSDLDQVEFRLTASFSEDPALIALFLEADATGGDVFTSIMRQVYKDDTLQKADKRRKLIKGVVYGKLYGAGVDKMAFTAGVSVADMKAVVDAFDATYPGVKRFQKTVEALGTKRLNEEGVGYITTATGRRLPCDEDRVYSLTNYLIQSTAAEVFKQNLIKLDAQDLTEFMIVPVHDEIVLQYPIENAAATKEFMETVAECMTTREGYAVPLTAGVEGPFANWGAKY